MSGYNSFRGFQLPRNQSTEATGSWWEATGTGGTAIRSLRLTRNHLFLMKYSRVRERANQPDRTIFSALLVRKYSETPACVFDGTLSRDLFKVLVIQKQNKNIPRHSYKNFHPHISKSSQESCQNYESIFADSWTILRQPRRNLKAISSEILQAFFENEESSRALAICLQYLKNPWRVSATFQAPSSGDSGARTSLEPLENPRGIQIDGDNGIKIIDWRGAGSSSSHSKKAISHQNVRLTRPHFPQKGNSAIRKRPCRFPYIQRMAKQSPINHDQLLNTSDEPDNTNSKGSSKDSFKMAKHNHAHLPCISHEPPKNLCKSRRIPMALHKQRLKLQTQSIPKNSRASSSLLWLLSLPSLIAWQIPNQDSSRFFKLVYLLKICYKN